MTLLFVSIALLFVLLGSGLWIAFAIGISGMVALYGNLGFRVPQMVGTVAWQTTLGFILAAVPLFILMGEVVSAGGLTDRLYSGLSKTIHGLKGELVQSNIMACTFFAAATGSSVASAATMGRIAYPEMARRGYDKAFVVGSIAAGGTLGILIPPSIPFIIYGMMVEQSVGRLFMAGVFPGIVLSFLFMVYIAIRATLQPKLVPASSAERVTLRERLAGLTAIWPILTLIVVVLGSIYGGIATPTEAAAVGAAGAMVLALLYRRLTPGLLFRACRDTVRTTAMIFLLLIAARVMAMATASYRVPAMLESWARGIGSPLLLLAAIILLYLVLGCLFDGLSMMILTLPFIMPIIKASGYDPIWFGVILVILIEIGLLTPPVGINLFVVQGATGVSLGTAARGSLPFWLLQLLGIGILILFPQIALWLPTRMIG